MKAQGLQVFNPLIKSSDIPITHANYDSLYKGHVFSIRIVDKFSNKTTSFYILSCSKNGLVFIKK